MSASFSSFTLETVSLTVSVVVLVEDASQYREAVTQATARAQAMGSAMLPHFLVEPRGVLLSKSGRITSFAGPGVAYRFVFKVSTDQLLSEPEENRNLPDEYQLLGTGPDEEMPSWLR